MISQVGARAIFALQAVINLAALPIIFLLGLSESAFHAMTCKGEKANLSTMTVNLFANLISIPVCLLMLATTEKISKAYVDCVSGILESLDSCFESMQIEDESCAL